jgi:hypothetical protein
MNEQDQQEYYERLASERVAAEGSRMQGLGQRETEVQGEGEGAEGDEGKQAAGERSLFSVRVLSCYCRQTPVCAQLGRLPHDFGSRPPASFLRCSVALASRAVVVTVSLTLSHLRSQSPRRAARRPRRPRLPSPVKSTTRFGSCSS